MSAQFNAGVCFILITRSGVEEMKSERERKRGANRNWRNYDFKTTLAVSAPSPLLSFFSYASSPLLSERKKRTREKPPSPFAEVTEVY